MSEIKLFGIQLIEHLEVFMIVWLVCFVIIMLVRALDGKRNVLSILLSIAYSLLNTIYFAVIAAVFRAGRDYPAMVSVILGTLLILACIWPYMFLRNHIVKYEETMSQN